MKSPGKLPRVAAFVAIPFLGVTTGPFEARAGSVAAAAAYLPTSDILPRPASHPVRMQLPFPA